MRYSLLVLVFAIPATAQEPIALRNATVETLAAAGRLEKATVLIRDGKIAAVGANVAIPDDARVIDAGGGTIMPGIIEPYFEVSIAAVSPDTGGSRTIIVRGRPVNVGGPGGGPGRGSFSRIADNFYPYEPGFKPLPRVGFTRLNLVSSGMGQAAVVRGTPSEPGQMLDRPDGVAYASVTNQTDSLDQIRTSLEGASRAKSAVGAAARVVGMAPSAGSQVWVDVIEGKTPLIATVANAASVLHLLKALEPHKNVKLIVHGTGVSLAETSAALKARGAKVVLRPTLELVPNTRDRFAPARALHEAGIEVAFSLNAKPPAPATGGPGDPTETAEEGPAAHDFPLFPVAMLVKTGLPRHIALEALSKQPAAMLGLQATNGTIEPGKAADLILFSGDPLDPASRLRYTMVDGRMVHANP